MATRKPLYLGADGTPTEMNLSDDLPVAFLPELTDLAVPATTLLEGVWPGDVIQFDGTKWRNTPLSFGSPGAAGSVCFYCASPTVRAKSADNAFPIFSLSTTPITTGESEVFVECPANSGVVLAAWRYNTPLGITTLPSGIWSPFIYCSVNDASGITWNTRNIAEIIDSGAVTFTTSDSGTIRTVTASAGFFESGDVGTTWFETAKGLYEITAYTSPTQVNISVPATYDNETSSFAGSRWKILFTTYSIDINGIYPTEMPMGWDSVQNNFAIAATSTLGIIDQVSNANGTGSITVTMTYDGLENITQHTRLFSTIPVGGAGSGGDPLTVTQFADLSSAHINALVPATVTALNDTLIESLTSTQIGRLTSTQLQGLTATQFASLPTTAIAGLTSTQMAAFSTTAVAGLQGVTVAPRPLTTTQMAGLGTAQIAAVTTTAMEGWTSTQISAMTTNAAEGLWTTLLKATPVVLCTGGTITTPGDGYKYHTFTSSSTSGLVVPTTGMVGGFIPVNVTQLSNAEYLVLGGGGSGGGSWGGGGGAGAYRQTSGHFLSGNNAVTIGVGGAGRVSAHIPGNIGGSSSLNVNGSVLTADGGGPGARYSGTTYSGNGSCGGSANSTAGLSGGAYGNNGGSGVTDAGAGGGGGAGSVGGNGGAANGGGGGGGVQWYDPVTGNQIYYAAGGGGGGEESSGVGGAGGSSLGGDGGSYNVNSGMSTAPTRANSGSGSGGSAYNASLGSPGPAGSDGIVIIRYKI